VKTLFCFLFFASLVTGPLPDSKHIVWKKLRTEEEVRAALQKRILPNASFNDVSVLLQQEPHEFLLREGDSVISFISFKHKGAFLISGKWMIRFHFLEGGLKGYTIREELSGP